MLAGTRSPAAVTGILCDQVAARIQAYYWKCHLLVDNGLFVWLFSSRLVRSNGDSVLPQGHGVTLRRPPAAEALWRAPWRAGRAETHVVESTSWYRLEPSCHLSDQLPVAWAGRRLRGLVETLKDGWGCVLWLGLPVRARARSDAPPTTCEPASPLLPRSSSASVTPPPRSGGAAVNTLKGSLPPGLPARQTSIPGFLSRTRVVVFSG